MLAEIQGRLNSEINQLQTFFDEYMNKDQLKSSHANIDPIERLINFNSLHQTFEYLNYAETLGRINPYVDNETLLNHLYAGWNLFHDGVVIERKILIKRIKAIKEDKKHDPEVLARQELSLKNLEEKKVVALLTILRIKASLSRPFNSFLK